MGIVNRLAAFVGLALLVSASAAAQNLDKGAAVFVAQKCSLCHALDGKGNAKGALDTVGSKLKADEIRRGSSPPPTWPPRARRSESPR